MATASPNNFIVQFIPSFEIVVMDLLQPFSVSKNAAVVHATLSFGRGRLQGAFTLDDSQEQVEESWRSGRWTSWSRADDLWKTTCFEVFWGVSGEPNYWELNLSPGQMKWNLYSFDAYRTPQPPRPCNDFELVEVWVESKSLNFILEPKVQFVGEFDVNLCAVIRTATSVQYHAITHSADKADFHARGSFTLHLRAQAFCAK